MPTGNSTLDDDIRQRLRQVAADFKQSEIAEKTGVHPTNVSRYLKGNRIPAEFCGEVIRGLGVNPAWLMVGEGSRSLSDVTEGTARMAGDVLELVEAMNAVTQMRLGALSGKHHLRVLRELDDALRRFEDLRERLNEQSKPVFRDLLDKLGRAMERRDVDQAEPLVKAAQQVSKLCHDEELSMQLDQSMALYQYLRMDMDASIEYQRRILGRRIIKGASYTHEEAMSAHNFARTLYAQGHTVAAWRIAKATIALTNEPPPQLLAIEASLAIEFGEAVRAVDVLRDMAHRVPPAYRPNVSMEFARALLVTGACTLGEVLEMGTPTPAKISRLLRFAGFTEDLGQIRALTARIEGWPDEMFPESITTQHILGLQSALEGDKRAPAAFRASQGKRDMNPVLRFNYHVIAAQLERLTGQKKCALDELRKAEQMRQKIKDPYAPAMERVAIHHHNALKLIASNERSKDLGRLHQQAQTWIKSWYQKGYACLGGLRQASN